MKSLKMFVVAFVLSIMFVFPCYADTIYSGELTTFDGSVTATDKWIQDKGGFQIVWEHFLNNGLYNYNYKITNAIGGGLTPDVSYFIFEVSENFTLENIKNFSGGTIADGPKTMNGIWGLKIEDMPETGIINISFLSDRMPMWGDFYTKGGNRSTAFNSEEFQLGVPDTQVVPVANTLVLLSTGMILIYTTGVRRKKV